VDGRAGRLISCIQHGTTTLQYKITLPISEVEMQMILQYT
jgi:hypothetical protein